MIRRTLLKIMACLVTAAPSALRATASKWLSTAVKPKNYPGGTKPLDPDEINIIGKWAG